MTPRLSPRGWFRKATVTLLVALVPITAPAQAPATCASADQCRDLTAEAIAAQQYERAHDLAWRLFQLAGPRDTSAMAMLARAQSLSGRGDDAFVMLQRLVAAGGVVEDVETSDDFRRVREHARWPQLLDALNDAKGRNVSATPPTDAPPRPSGVGKPAARARLAEDKPTRPETPAAAAPASDDPSPSTPPASSVPPSSAAVGNGESSSELLSLPTALSTPNVIAYDAVSARFIVSDPSSDVMLVVSEHSGNATKLVSAGWSGQSHVTAIGIDRRNGDLWVAASGEKGAVLHRMQLVSGRLLQSIPSTEGRTASSFTALNVTPEGVYVLDGGAGQILLLPPKSTSWRVVAPLPDGVDVLSMAYAGSALYVSHAGGLLRVDLTSRSHQAVTAPKELDLTGLHALAWRANSLVAIQALNDGSRVVRLRLNARGSAATSRTIVEDAAGTAGASAGDAYYFLTRRQGENGLAFRSVRAR